MWLATIDPARVKPEVRPKLTHYQRDAARVLREHFFPPANDGAPLAEPAAPPEFPTLAAHLLAAADEVMDQVERDLSTLARFRARRAPQEEKGTRALSDAVHSAILWAWD